MSCVVLDNLLDVDVRSKLTMSCVVLDVDVGSKLTPHGCNGPMNPIQGLTPCLPFRSSLPAIG